MLSFFFFFLKQVDRHLRKLDQELAKFKMELEADNAGITEILERRKYNLWFFYSSWRVVFSQKPARSYMPFGGW